MIVCSVMAVGDSRFGLHATPCSHLGSNACVILHSIIKSRSKRVLTLCCQRVCQSHGLGTLSNLLHVLAPVHRAENMFDCVSQPDHATEYDPWAHTLDVVQHLARQELRHLKHNAMKHSSHVEEIASGPRMPWCHVLFVLANAVFTDYQGL